MLYFPQLPSGCLGQYPIKKRRAERTVFNELADGRSVKLPSPGAEWTQWQLSFQDLSDAEMEALVQFFASCEGQLNEFTFLDPMSNLLVWSETLTQPAWESSTLLQITDGIDDPTGGVSASRVTNATASDLTVQQTINAPGWFTYSLSVYVRGQSGASILLFREAGIAGVNHAYEVQPGWKRMTLSGSLNTTATSVTVGVTIPAGQAVDLFGFQLEAQPAPSLYKKSFSASGVYSNAHFSEDSLAVTTTGLNRSQCTLAITAR